MKLSRETPRIGVRPEQNRRVAIALAAAPAVVPAFFFVYGLLDGARPKDSFLIAGIIAAFAYGAALLGGLPVYLKFERKGWTRWWQYAAAGAAIGLAVLAILLLVDHRGSLYPGAVAKLAKIGLIYFALPGALSATLFWSIAILPDLNRTR